MLAGSGSAMIAASSRPSRSLSAARSASGSFQGTTTVPAAARRHAGARRETLGGQARAGLREQGVEVPVVGAGELEQMLTPGGRAREADGGHRRLGPRGGHAQHLDALDPARDLHRQLDLGGRRRAEAGALRRRGRDRIEHGGWACPWIRGPQEQT